jgi:hypothetical protein
MAKLYIANLSKQVHEFHYRVPAEVGYSRQAQIRTILPGTQQQIHSEAPLVVLEAIVDQHRQYGLIEATEVHKAKGFVNLCFSFDVPVNLDQLNYGVDHNQGALFDQGLRNREEAAVAFDHAVDSNLQDAQHRGELRGSAAVRAVSVETLEDADAPKFGEGVRVDHLQPIDGGRRRSA